MEYRAATSSDIEVVAGLHAESWRRNYRGAFSDSYLDGDVYTDRLGVWRDRLTLPDPNQYTVVAELDGVVVGFAHTIFDDDPTWGALLDNLHAAHHVKGQGIGTRLMSESARSLIEQRPAMGLYLWVLEQNTPAQAFYDARGGKAVGHETGGPFPGGGTAPSIRYAWPDPRILIVEGL
jgi:ribosomal protein S18 acetylase RimI-like enzyme